MSASGILPEGSYQPDGSYLYKHPIPSHSVKQAPKTMDELLRDPYFVLTCLSLVISISVFFYYLKKLLQAAVVDRRERVEREKRNELKRAQKKHIRKEERREGMEYTQSPSSGSGTAAGGNNTTKNNNKTATNTFLEDDDDHVDFEVVPKLPPMDPKVQKTLNAIQRGKGLTEAQKRMVAATEARLQQNKEAAKNSYSGSTSAAETRSQIDAEKEDEEFITKKTHLKQQIDTFSKKLERYTIIQKFAATARNQSSSTKKNGGKNASNSNNSNSSSTSSEVASFAALSKEEENSLRAELKKRNLTLEADKEDREDSLDEDSAFVEMKYRDKIRLASEALRRLEEGREQALLIRKAQAVLREGATLKSASQKK